MGRVLGSPRYQAFAALVVAVAGAAALYLFAPGGDSYYPRCLLYSTTGWYCPGCGSLRALHALLHGRFAEAVDLNAWMMAVLPFGFAYGVRQFYTALRHDRYWKSRSAVAMMLVLLAAGLVFGVARNLPLHALAWLAP